MQKSDDTLDVIICVVPEIVYANCRPQSRVQDGLGYRVSAGPRRERQSGQLDMLDEYPPDTYAYSVDFRRQIKARAMEFNIPIQIVRESALRLTPPSTDSDRRLTPISDRAWNLGVALYYKSGGKAVGLTSARREGVLQRI
jgi:hypothetical protein